MDIQELKQFIEASEFTPETKQKIAVIMAGKAILDYDTYAAIKEILQQELDNDFDDAGADISDDPEALAEEARYEAELEALNAEMEEDAKFIEEETKKLNELNAQIKSIEVAEIKEETPV